MVIASSCGGHGMPVGVKDDFHPQYVCRAIYFLAIALFCLPSAQPNRFSFRSYETKEIDRQKVDRAIKLASGSVIVL